MKERPIIFTADSVRAILDGQKIMTRRVVKPQPALGGNAPWMNGGWFPNAKHKKARHYANESHFKKGMPKDFCPYGIPGDRLWVKEVWWDAFRRTADENGCVYKADYGHRMDLTEYMAEGQPWKSPRFMFRWASRIMLELTAIRLERVQDISEEDAQAEGCMEDVRLIYDSAGPAAPVDYEGLYAAERFSDLWEKINGKHGFGWNVNPWVWVLEFKLVVLEGTS